MAASEPWPRSRRPIAAFFRDHAGVIRDSFRYTSHHFGTSLLVWLLIGTAMSAPAGLYLLQRNIEVISRQWESLNSFSVYFNVDASAGDVEALVQQMSSQVEIEAVTTVTPEEALDEFSSYTEITDALTLLQSNPLPASARVTVDDDVSVTRISEIASQFERADAVDEIVVERSWLGRLKAINELIARLGWVLGILFGIGSILITAASVRLALEMRLEEIKVLKLVGATDAFVKRPFLYFGAIYGFGGSLVTAMVLSAALILLEAPLGALGSSYGAMVRFQGDEPAFYIGLVLVGVVMGVAGGLVASNQRLREINID
ncbi:MAG: permease-like cell division protein FtsX [Pseudomonadales bacterium]|nr:permease-like cell division protein FtsX [Pseudomonadales bacterium]